MLIKKSNNIKEYSTHILLVVASLSPFIFTECLLGYRNTDFIKPIRIVTSGSRAEDFRDYHMFTDEAFIPDPFLFWKLNPKNKLSNSKGFIGPEFSITKPDNVIRVFCLGDSNTMGTLEDSYPFEMDRLLQWLQPSNNKIEVINAGLSGYTSLQGLRLFSEIIKYKPDLVSVCFGWNDPCFTNRQPDKFFQPLNKSLLYLERFLYRFKTFQFLKYTILRLQYKKQRKNIDLSRRVSLEDYGNNLIGMVNLAKENRIKLLFITRPCVTAPEPWMESFVNDTKIYNSKMRSIAKKLNVPIIDAEASYNDRYEYFADACHFNDKGRKLFAEEMYTYVKEQIK